MQPIYLYSLKRFLKFLIMLPSVFYLSEAFIQLFTHIEMSSNLSGKYYEDSKERPKKSTSKISKSF